MKKGLLSILALAVTIVGCQNYDDQFDALNTQITALKSQVDGLAAVQSAVTALQGQLSALSSAALTNADLDAALSAGLADIISDVEAVQAAVADVATSAEVDAVNDALTDAQSDLDDLLQSNNVYNDDVIVNSEATLTWAQGLGTKLTIVNGSVVIDVNADMDTAIVQEVVNNIGTVTGQFSYYATSSTINSVSFDNIIGVEVLEVAQSGDISFDGLISASDIFLGNNYQNSVTAVDFPALNSVDSFITGELTDNGGTADGYITATNTSTGISFTKAESVNLSALPRYNSASFGITMKKGGSLDISALTSTNTDNEVVGRTLDITGPASLSFTNYKDGRIKLTDVETASIDGFYGTIEIESGVETLTITDGVAIDITGASDLVNATIDGRLDWDPERTTAATLKDDAQDLDFNSSDLENLTLSGDLGSVTLNSEGNLTTLTINGTIKDLNLTNLGDLTTVDVSSATMRNVTVDNCDDLGDVTFDHTFGNGGATTDLAATVIIQNNANLGNLVWSADKVNSLTVKNNDDLATVNFTDLTNLGETTASADIQANDFTASSATDSWGDANGDDDDTDTGEGEGTEEGTSTDSGSYTTDSGLATLKTWLDKAVAAPAAGGVKVALDDVEVYISEADVAASNTEQNNPTADLTDFEDIHWVVYVTAAGPDTAAKFQTQSFFVPVAAASLDDVTGTSGINTSEFDAAGDNLVIDYPVSPNKTISWDTDDAATIADFISHFNTEADLDGFDLTITQNAKYQKTYLVSYIDTDGTGGSVSAAGSILLDYGTDTGLTIPAASVTAGDGEADLADLIAQEINHLTSYSAVGSGVDGYAFVVVSPRTEDEDDITAVRRNTLPSSITISRTGGTVSWSSAATNAETSFTLSIGTGAARYAGFTVTAKNTNQNVNRAITGITGNGFFGTVSQLSAASFYGDGNVDGSATTTVDSEIGSYVRAFADIVASAAGAAGENTNRLSWLSAS